MSQARACAHVCVRVDGWHRGRGERELSRIQVTFSDRNCERQRNAVGAAHAAHSNAVLSFLSDKNTEWPVSSSMNGLAGSAVRSSRCKRHTKGEIHADLQDKGVVVCVCVCVCVCVSDQTDRFQKRAPQRRARSSMLQFAFITRERKYDGGAARKGRMRVARMAHDIGLPAVHLQTPASVLRCGMKQKDTHKHTLHTRVRSRGFASGAGVEVKQDVDSHGCWLPDRATPPLLCSVDQFSTAHPPTQHKVTRTAKSFPQTQTE
jgi:hypothetical protein